MLRCYILLGDNDVQSMDVVDNIMRCKDEFGKMLLANELILNHFRLFELAIRKFL